MLHDGFDSEDLPLALDLTAEAETSELFGSAPADVMNDLTRFNTTMNNHVSG